MRFIALFVSAILLLIGCAGAPKIKDKKKEIKKPLIYKIDFNRDGIRESVQVENKDVTGRDTVITVYDSNRKDKKELDKFEVEDFSSIEFIDLDNNGFKQMVIYTKDDSGYCNLSIYSLKNGKLNEIFTIGSPVSLDVNFKSCIPRIKAGIPREASNAQGPTCEVWVWSGYKFIKDHNE